MTICRRIGLQTCWSASLVAALILLLFFVAPAAGQVFKLQGGSSSLFDAHGGSMEFRGSNYTGRISIGLLGETRLGFFLAAPYRGFTWGLGDHSIPFALPTDLFNHSYYFLGRGLSASRKYGRSKVFLYAGTTSTGYSVPFFSVARAEKGAGAVFFERQLSSSLRFLSHNVFSARQTSIQTLEWTAREDLKLAMSSGIGSNQGYWSSSFDFSRRWVSLEASYAWAGRSFRRIQVEMPLQAETDRENVRLELMPRQDVRFYVARQNYLAPLGMGSGVAQRATVNSVGASGGVAGFQLHGSFFDSETQMGTSKAVSLGGRRRLFERVDLGVDYLRSAPPKGDAVQTLVSTIREFLTPRLTLSQMITHGSGQTTMAFGGNFLSNRLTAGIEYQTVFLPFAQGGGSQFRQVLVVNLRLQLPRSIEVNAATFVDPLGRVRYTGYASGFIYRGVPGDSGGSAPSTKFHPYVVRGRVVDDTGEPVRGAALRIDGEMVYTDSLGAFFVRLKKAKTCQLHVVPAEFILPGNYEVLDAPLTVEARPEDDAPLYEVRMRRVRTRPADATGSEIGALFKNGALVPFGATVLVPPFDLSPDFVQDFGIWPAVPVVPLDYWLGASGRAGKSKSLRAPGKRNPAPRLRRSTRSKRAAQLSSSERRASGANARNRKRAVGRAAGNSSRAGKRIASRPARAGEHVALRPGADTVGRVPVAGNTARGSGTSAAQERR